MLAQRNHLHAQHPGQCQPPSPVPFPSRAGGVFAPRNDSNRDETRRDDAIHARERRSLGARKTEASSGKWKIFLRGGGNCAALFSRYSIELTLVFLVVYTYVAVRTCKVIATQKHDLLIYDYGKIL